MQRLSERTTGFTDSVIRRMTRVSLEHGAVNLSQGFPDFDPPQAILDRLAEVAHEDYHQYAITWGAQGLREALAAKQSRLMGRTIDPNGESVVTCGSTEAMMAAMLTVTDPGDKVVIFSPFYENYGADTILSGAEPIYVPLTPPTFRFDPEGAYYVLLDISEFGYDDDLRFCEDLARLVGVGAVPGSSFFREPVHHLIRLHFAKRDETLLAALERLQDLRKKIPPRKRG